jgi:hypothetical protein
MTIYSTESKQIYFGARSLKRSWTHRQRANRKKPSTMKTWVRNFSYDLHKVNFYFTAIDFGLQIRAGFPLCDHLLTVLVTLALLVAA